MQLRNSASRYGFIASSLHWVIAAGIIAQYFLAEAAEEHEGAAGTTFDPASLHISIGVALLALAALRLLWRIVELPPERPQAMKQYERVLARCTHFAFYFLLFALPLTGWALSAAEAQPIGIFGLFELPPLRLGALTKDQLEEVHEVLFNVLFGLALLHVAAALKHHFIDRDNVFRSMLPR